MLFCLDYLPALGFGVLEHMIAVIDTSALVALSGVRRLDLLRACFSKVLIPEGVRVECVDQGDGWVEAEDAKEAIRKGTWLETVCVEDTIILHELRAKLGRGEAETIELARVRRVPAILDDREARTEANRRGVEVVGSLGILAKCRRNGILGSLRPVVEQMRANGIRYSDTLIEQFLRETDA